MIQTTQKKKKYKVEALGCRTNQYEAQAFRDQLTGMGYEQASDGEEADLCIVNTCTVTESADSSSRHLIRQFAKQNPQAKVVVTGCLAERDPSSLINISGVAKVVSNKDKEQLLDDLFPAEDVPEFSIKRFDAHTRAFVKVQDGCNSFCTYCIIPYVRGRSRSRTVDEIVAEVKELVKSGYKEVVLTGINVGDFDGAGDGKDRLHHLVRAVDAIDGLERLRVSSIDPDEIDDDLTDAILNGKKTCHSMHIVLQAGSNVVLKRMNRKYTRQIFLDTVRRLKNISPDFTVTTDIIVGFPGETESDFQETLEVIREVEFAKVHMFPYSDRPRTKANLFPNKVPHDVIRERKSQVLKMAEEVSYLLRQKYVGRSLTILTEEMGKDHPDTLYGHTANFLGVSIPKEGLAVNELVEVELLSNSPDGLIGKVIRKVSS
jgi:threonylcarbamoyladenosine tRNA methylthiotransferase MtaB